MSKGHVTAGPDWGYVDDGDGVPYTIADIHNIRTDPSLGPSERMEYRRGLVANINSTIANNPNLKSYEYLDPDKVTWKQILKTMMDLQLEAGK